MNMRMILFKEIPGNVTFGWYSPFPGMLRIYTKDAVELHTHRNECIILKPLCCYFLTILGFLHSHSDHLFIIRQILKNFLWQLIHRNNRMFSLSKDKSTLGESFRISPRLWRPEHNKLKHYMSFELCSSFTHSAWCSSAGFTSTSPRSQASQRISSSPAHLSPRREIITMTNSFPQHRCSWILEYGLKNCIMH